MSDGKVHTQNPICIFRTLLHQAGKLYSAYSAFINETDHLLSPFRGLGYPDNLFKEFTKRFVAPVRQSTLKNPRNFYPHGPLGTNIKRPMNE